MSKAVVTRKSAFATHCILGIFSIVALTPFIGIMLISFSPDGQAVAALTGPHSFGFHNYVRAWTAGNFGTLLGSSIIVAVAVVPLASFGSILTGYAFGIMSFRFKSVLLALFLVGLVMPFEATIIPLYYDLRSVGLANTRIGLILPEAALYLSFGTLWMRAHFLSISRDIVESARIDGARSWTILWRILVPSAGPAITAMATLFFIWSWNEFLLALVLAQAPNIETVPAGLASFVGEHTTDLPGLAAGSVIITIPALIVYVALQRKFIQGVTSGSIKG